MKASERITLLYALGIVGAAGVSYYRGRRGQQLVAETAIHGVVAGTALNVANWLLIEEASPLALANPLPNPFAALTNAKDMGRMGKKAIELLSEVDDNLFKDFKGNGVKVGEIPSNPSMVNQDAN